MINYIGYIACILGGIIACCLETSHAKFDDFHVYGLSGYDAFYYYIAEEVDGELQGIDYVCDESEYGACTIYSSHAPDVMGRIPRPAALVSSYSAVFVDLNPSQ